ncbi:MAG: hypothetical protein AVDCRST_MAG67-2664, partial [uncultured Solirubrobacteraceae bacterium]
DLLTRPHHRPRRVRGAGAPPRPRAPRPLLPHDGLRRGVRGPRAGDVSAGVA